MVDWKKTSVLEGIWLNEPEIERCYGSEQLVTAGGMEAVTG